MTELTKLNESEAVIGPGERDRPSDEEILKFEKEIKKAEQEKALISQKMDFTQLKLEYSKSGSNLTSQYSMMRTTRRDGNCFYRAVGFRFCEILKRELSDQNNSTSKFKPWATWAFNNVKESKNLLVKGGYDLIAVEDFYTMFIETLNKEPDQIFADFLTEYVSDTIVCYLKLVTAAYLKLNSEMFEMFILDSYPTLEDFISSQVVPMNIEADNPQIVALVNALGLNVKIANLDTSLTQNGEENYHDFSPFESVVDNIPTVTLLFRPGHYDILYPNYEQ
ncbi:OTU domain, ubiquitin aldehyde binding [Clydaea vesicula]|uniref:ubiquitinyl hydrolase 1 n=1 Tax=Clydaea vesicula TaxID=447962 RepID=A0AAD5Y1U4_9FUNG|nr:OTU domain, ubiquitin aldehyde binding [Clydaea vesicula]KAJ3388129.1 OTU domain, ubiquitin aldehyde binding [Lobulomyces angularis]